MSRGSAVRIDEASLGDATGSLEDCTFSQPDVVPPRYRVMGPDGPADLDVVSGFDLETYRELFGWMVTQQVVDERMVKLQRRGELGTYASGRGQEASIVGFGAALEDDDWLYPYGRDAAAMLMKGMSLRDLMLYWRGVMDANRLPGANVFPINVPIGTHIPVGVGYAWGMARDGSDGVVGVMFGESHPSTGEGQAGMNFGGVLEVPAVFHCQNNGYAISMPFEGQTAANSVAQKALAWGFDGIRVDGNDVLAVYEATRRARERALDGTPTIVETVSYRLGAHTTNDDPRRYRSDEEVEYWEAREPVGRFRAFLKAEGVWDDIDEDELREAANDRFDEAKAAADDYESGGVEELFEYVYAETPPELERQLAELEAVMEARPDFDDYVEERPKG